MKSQAVKSLSDRMKEYEDVSNIRLTRRTPVIARIDGKAFHTYTRGMEKPFDEILANTFQKVCISLVQQVQGCKLAYTQSDEISLLLTDWDKLTTDSFFDYRVQKMASVLASMTTMLFNKCVTDMVLNCTNLDKDRLALWKKKMGNAMFDARVFNLPKEEVCNYFIWRQEDASRNSIQSLGRSKFSAKQMANKSNEEVQEMLFSEFGINWNNIETRWKRGLCVERVSDGIGTDFEIPLFKQNRNYIDKFLFTDDLI